MAEQKTVFSKINRKKKETEKQVKIRRIWERKKMKNEIKRWSEYREFQSKVRKRKKRIKGND